MSGINPAGYVTKPVCEHLQQMEDIAAHAKKTTRLCWRFWSAIKGLERAEQSKGMMEKFCLITKQFFNIFTRKE